MKALKLFFMFIFALGISAYAKPNSELGPLRAGTYLVFNKNNRIPRLDGENFNLGYTKNFAFKKRTVINPGTKVQYTGKFTKRNGGYGLQVKVVSGNLKGHTFWVWYSPRDSSMSILPDNFLPDDEPVPDNPAEDDLEGRASLKGDENCIECKKNEVSPFYNLLQIINGVSTKISNLSSGAIGARKVMATMFQTCSVLDMLMPSQRGKNPFDYVKPDRRPVCRDPGNPRYGWGSKLKISRHEIDVIKGRNPGVDCSGFVLAGWAVAGLRMSENNDSSSSYGTNTHGLMTMADKKGSCVRSAKITGKESIRSGDLIVQTRGSSNARHVVMVESTGLDPFGLNKISKVGQCSYSKLDTNNFDFTLIQSSGGVGPARWKAKDYLYRAGAAFRGAVKSIALKACMAKFAKNPVPANGRNGGINYSLIRHANSSACINPNPPDLKNDKCTEGCQKIAAN